MTVYKVLNVIAILMLLGVVTYLSDISAGIGVTALYVAGRQWLG